MFAALWLHVEVLDENGQHVKEGETGEVVVTSFSNYVMSFIRYRTGDLVEYGGKKNGIVILKSGDWDEHRILYIHKA